MSRRKIESPEEYRQMEANSGQQSNERKSVFERLGTTVQLSRRVVTSNRTNDFNETDLRFKVSRKRRANDSPNRRSVSPQTRHHSSAKSLTKSDDKLDTKVKSLVLAPNRRSESPPNVAQSVSTSSTSKRSTHSSHKWDDDIDSEELEQKRLELQKQLQELEKSGSIVKDNKRKNSLTTPLPIAPTVVSNRSRSSSIISSESDSYSSSLKSMAKTESSESSGNNIDKKVVNSCVKTEDKVLVKEKRKSGEKSRTHVSSSISLKSVTHLEDSTPRVKTSEVKFDRHGNVRISLDEQERQKRLRAERFNQFSDTPKKKKSTNGSNSPPMQRPNDSSVERHRNISDSSKPERRDDYKSKNSSARNKYESTRSRSPERRGSRGSRHEDTRSKCSDKSSTNYLDTKSGGLRDRSRDSRVSDRDNTSVTSKQSRRRDDNYSRDHSPTHSSHSKLSRDRESSIGSDFSRRSKSERLSSHDLIVHNLNNSDLKTIEIKSNDTNIEEMSPISANSSIPDVPEVDSPNIETKVSPNKSEEKSSPNKVVKTEDESEDNFSDWSEGEDELLLKTDGFETLDEVCNISDNSMTKDSWTEKSWHKSKRESNSSESNHNKDDALEAISDDELDAIIGESDPIDSTSDSKHISSSRQVLDSLEINWGSLVTEPKAKLEFIPGSARKRFSAANVLMRIGFSQAFAGQQMTNKLIEFCQNELKQEFVPFRHPMAAIHSSITERIRERRNLFGADTAQTAVLSGRKDLQIRKMLNKSNFKVFDNCLTSNTSITAPIPTQPTTSSSINDLSVSTTNITESHVSDIECF